MIHKSLLAASAAVTLLAVSSGAEARECIRGDRVETGLSTAVQRTDRMFKRVGDTLVRTGDRMFGWINRRPRT